MVAGGFEIVGFGEAMVLLQPPPGGRLDAAPQLDVHVAGAELNLCAAAARLGLSVAFCSRVGDDPLGARVLAETRRLGVAADLVAADPAFPTGLFLKDVRADGQRRVHYYRRGSAASMLDEEDCARLLSAPPRLVAVSGVTAALGPGPLAAVRKLVDRARAAGVMVAFDPNFRPALGPVAEQADAVRDLLDRVDVLLLGQDEAEPLLGVADPAAVFAAAMAAGVGETVLKAGADGCYHQSSGGPRHVPSLATEIVDPVGAGDAFAGGYLAARLRGASPSGAAWLASVLAAGVVATPGDTEGLPSASKAAALLAESLTR
jgi:2-dehydro-3-deoxygluconokinase